MRPPAGGDAITTFHQPLGKPIESYSRCIWGSATHILVPRGASSPAEQRINVSGTFQHGAVVQHGSPPKKAKSPQSQNQPKSSREARGTNHLCGAAPSSGITEKCPMAGRGNRTTLQISRQLVKLFLLSVASQNFKPLAFGCTERPRKL